MLLVSVCTSQSAPEDGGLIVTGDRRSANDAVRYREKRPRRLVRLHEHRFCANYRSATARGANHRASHRRCYFWSCRCAFCIPHGWRGHVLHVAATSLVESNKKLCVN